MTGWAELKAQDLVDGSELQTQQSLLEQLALRDHHKQEHMPEGLMADQVTNTT